MVRKNFQLIVLISILSSLVISPALEVQAQSENKDAQSTPVGDEAEPMFPEFYLEAVGDFPEGYFRDVEVQPGTSVELTVMIVNSGQIPVELEVYKVNALSSFNGGYTSGDKTDAPIGATSWISFSPFELVLDPGQQHLEIFSVEVPEGTAPGQYVSGLMARTSNTVEIPGTDVLDQSIGYAISLSVLVPGDIQESFVLDEPEILASGNNRSLSVPVSNTGNYLVRPEGVLILKDSNGDVVMNYPVKMGSIYSGLDTAIRVLIPEQTPAGEYYLDLELTDPASGVKDSLQGVLVTVPEPVDPTGVSVANASIEPNADEIVFANVDITLNNGGQQIPASDVTLEVLRDGEQVDQFPLATNQVLLNGENTYTTRYIPAEMWEPGTYTFRIVVSAVDPNGGQETILLTEDLDAEIVVP